MNILCLHESDGLSAFERFMQQVSAKLATNIARKLMVYKEINAISASTSLKILNPRIWGYKGTIYKLRVDCGKESARVLFVKTAANDIVLLHGFLKTTRKTPSRDARIAIDNYERVKNNAAVKPVAWMPSVTAAVEALR